MNIQISNLDAQATQQDLKELFAPFGTVQSAEIALDAFTDLPRGFGYVEMPEEEEARQAISQLHGSQFSGRVLIVQEAQPRLNQKGSYKVGNGAVNVYRFRKN